MTLSKIITSAAFIFCCLCSKAQTKTSADKCNGDCCKKVTNPKQNNSIVKPVSMIAATKDKRVVSCKLTTPELRQRKEEVLASLKGKVLEKQELKNGYKYKFEGSDQILDELVSFIKTERMCCDFFSFNLSISDDKSHIWLLLTGPEGAKDFIKTEMDL